MGHPQVTGTKVMYHLCERSFMAKFGYYKQGQVNAVLIQEFEGTGTRINGPDSVTIYEEHGDETHHDIATIHLNKGEWVAKVANVSPQQRIA
jgi:hypothetical protein